MFVLNEFKKKMNSENHSWVTEAVMNFGRKHGVVALAETVFDLYDAALAPASKKTYKTGQRAYFRFVQQLER